MKTYLIFDGRHYKIGKSKAPIKRLKAIRTGNPEVRLIAFGEGASERLLHIKYKKNKVNGEWYKLNNNQVCDIIYLLKNEYGGYKINKNQIAQIKRKENKDRLGWNRYSETKITFGKYKGQLLIDMNSKEELSYIDWCINNFRDKKTKIYKAFRWWVREHRQANLFYQAN